MLYRILWFSVIHQQESATGTPMSLPYWTSLLPPSPSNPSAFGRAPVWVPWVLQQIPIGYLFYYVTLFIHLPFPLLSSHLVHSSVLYVCFSIAVMKINSSVPSLQIPYICVSIQYLYFSFWLTSLCIMGYSFIHLIRTESNAFLFMAE